MSSEQGIFATLRAGARVWAVGAVHGEAERLAAVHAEIDPLFEAGDQIVYLGNYSGHGLAVRETIDELLTFRRSLIARDGVDPEDVIFLRGAQEEMWQKMLQLQFAPNPAQVLQWMVAQGIEPTVDAYHASIDDAMLAAREGVLSLTRWTGQVRANIRLHDGHTQLMSALRHAAYTDAVLFVHAGIDPHRPLSAQSDSFWWGSPGFAGLAEPYGSYTRVVRGFDRKHEGWQETAHTVSIDGGCGFGGVLLAACFAPDGGILHKVGG